MRILIAVLSFLFVAACAREADAPRDPVLDGLFTELASAPSAEAAAPIEQRIWQRWRRSDSATVRVLMERAAAAENAGNDELALDFLAEASDLAPHFAEPWNRRAILAYDSEDYAGAILAIEQVLEREPRHFGALTGLGHIYESLGRNESALEAYQAALEIHPHFEEARRGVARLSPRVDGADA